MSDFDETKAYSVRCPLCRAKPNKPCLNEQKQKNKVPHVARIEAYLRFLDPSRGFFPDTQALANRPFVRP